MSLYEKIVDMAEGDCTELPTVISSLKEADSSGQFLTSSARYLWAVDRERFATQVSELIEAAIDRDRERRYISSLLEAIWGHDYSRLLYTSPSPRDGLLARMPSSA